MTEEKELDKNGEATLGQVKDPGQQTDTKGAQRLQGLPVTLPHNE